MRYKGRKEIIIASIAFLIGIFAGTYHMLEQKQDTTQQQHQLFDLEENIIGVSDQAFVEMSSCYESVTCDAKQSSNKIDSLLKYRKQYEMQKKELISHYPNLVSENERKRYGTAQ